MPRKAHVHKRHTGTENAKALRTIPCFRRSVITAEEMVIGFKRPLPRSSNPIGFGSNENPILSAVKAQVQPGSGRPTPLPLPAETAGSKKLAV